VYGRLLLKSHVVVLDLHVQLTAQGGLGVADLDRIEVRGEAIADVTRRFIPYQEAAQYRFGAARIVERNACTGCMGEVVKGRIRGQAGRPDTDHGQT